MYQPTVASLVRRNLRLHSAQRVLEMYSAGENFLEYLDDLPPEMRRAVEGLLRAAAESWGNAVAAHERTERNDAEFPHIACCDN